MIAPSSREGGHLKTQLIAFGLLAASPAAAEVTASSDTSFTVTHKVTIAAPVASGMPMPIVTRITMRQPT